MWIFLVAPKQRPTFPSNRNNLGRAGAVRSSRCNAHAHERLSRACICPDAKDRSRRRLVCRDAVKTAALQTASEEFVVILLVIGDLSCNR